MIDHIVIDVEIQKTIEETPGGWDATDLLGVAVACVWEYRTQRMRVYGPDDIEPLRERILQADRISGYNIFNFDFPVIWGKSKQQWAKDRWSCDWSYLFDKTDDMLQRIWQTQGLNPDRFDKTIHGGYSLEAIASGTLKASKIGYGGDAPRWYQQGRIQKVVNYCADDVALERDLTDFVERYGYVIHNGKKLDIPAWKGGV